jgi:hypothetical protein
MAKFNGGGVTICGSGVISIDRRSLLPIHKPSLLKCPKIYNLLLFEHCYPLSEAADNGGLLRETTRKEELISQRILFADP